MTARIAWNLSALAFEAGQREGVPEIGRRALIQLGVVWFWAALACEGRAMEVWRDLRVESAQTLHPQNRSVWAACTDALHNLAQHGCGSECRTVEAWSLPATSQMRRLGLGRVWVVHCPYCQCFHTHSPDEGMKAAHCAAPEAPRAYVVRHGGELPFEHHTRFYNWIREERPRFLRSGSEDDAQDLLAIERCAA